MRTENHGIGRDKDIERVIDKEDIDKSVAMYRRPLHMKRQPMGSTSPGIGGAPIPSFMLKKRDASGATGRHKRSNKHWDHLIVTPYPEHSAIELCQSETSWGPDEVSLNERIFCDMGTKTLFPLCDDKIEHDCFNLDIEMLVLRDDEEKDDDDEETEEDDKETERDNVHIKARGLPLVKRYNTTSYW